MCQTVVVKRFREVFAKEMIVFDEPMKNHTSFRTGGTADVLFLPDSTDQLRESVCFCAKENIPYFVMGNGSNLLVRDHGFRGVIIKISKKVGCVWSEGNVIHAESGALLAEIAAVALQSQLTGFEFASGIPGSLGGAVYMNAGAYGSEMKDVVEDAVVFDSAGDLVTINNAALGFGYRTSRMQMENSILLSARIKLAYGERDIIRETMQELNKRRKEKQPLELPSAGSTFKRPVGFFAGQLIEENGLKGVSIGGAQVSLKHAGFIVNTGTATTQDILDLIAHVQAVVEKNTGVFLEPEVRIIGE